MDIALADIFSKNKRSEIMSRIRSTGTTPEKRLYSLVRQILGPRRCIYRNRHQLPGHPDILIPSLKLAIFADGCFYHRCPKHGRLPATNQEYWLPKLERNVQRDHRDRRALRRLGYRVWRFWEHDLKSQALERTSMVLKNRFRLLLTK